MEDNKICTAFQTQFKKSQVDLRYLQQTSCQRVYTNETKKLIGMQVALYNLEHAMEKYQEATTNLVDTN